MNNIRLLFGKPVIRDRNQLLTALRELQASSGCIVQVLDADRVVSEEHLRFATKKALLAFSEGRNIAKDPGMEILRYASGERQIEKALSMGISEATERIALVIINWPKNECRCPEDTELAALIYIDGLGCSFKPDAVKKAFSISDEEINVVDETRLSELVLERVALVETYR
ncbi:MAG: KEOPS complex subunit Cgi121 [Methanotrichaceae archaeon]|nr:KEOPS complex subunit Cgi121 [Methanotrichaceae archaeon]